MYDLHFGFKNRPKHLNNYSVSSATLICHIQISFICLSRDNYSRVVCQPFRNTPLHRAESKLRPINNWIKTALRLQLIKLAHTTPLINCIVSILALGGKSR